MPEADSSFSFLSLPIAVGVQQLPHGFDQAVAIDFGRGKAVYVGACPGLSYLKDAGFVPMELKERYPPIQRRVRRSTSGW